MAPFLRDAAKNGKIFIFVKNGNYNWFLNQVICLFAY